MSDGIALIIGLGHFLGPIGSAAVLCTLIWAVFK